MARDNERYVGRSVRKGLGDVVNHSQTCKLISTHRELLEVVCCVAACLLGKRSAVEGAGQILATQNGPLAPVLPPVLHVNML